MRKVVMIALGSILLFCSGSCSVIDEDSCKVNHLLYRYMNNVGQESTSLYLNEVTDFIFRKDSVLYRVDEHITNGKIARRPINLPDGDWIIYSYANLNGGSRLSTYAVGKTRLSEMSVRVITSPTYSGTYAPDEEGKPTLRLGNADRLYFGKVALSVRGGYTGYTSVIEMSNIHIRLNATVRFLQPIDLQNNIKDNLHVRLEYVPVEFGFKSIDKMDHTYQIAYSTPLITPERASYSTKLDATPVANEYNFQMYGLRWETGGAPILKFYNGETLLINKELPLNKYFNEQRIDLTHTRVQFYNLLIEVDGEHVYISDTSIADWEDGGNW